MPQVNRFDVLKSAQGWFLEKEIDFAGCYPDKVHLRLSRSPVSGLVLTQMYPFLSNFADPLKPKTFL